MIVFINFQDPYSARTHTVLLPKLLEGYGSRLRIIYKDLPLTALHVWAMHAAIDANCLLQQSSDSYWEFADHVFRSQKTIGGNSRAEAFLNLDLNAMRIGDQRGLDIPRLQACVNNSDETNVRASIREADQLGIDSTPTFFINDEIVVGANEDQIRASIDRNLASPD